jgi:hypothetical protein
MPLNVAALQYLRMLAPSVSNMPGAFREGGFNDGYTITAWDSMAQSNTDGRVLLSPEPYLAVAETVNEPDFVQATPLQETGTHANSSPPEGPMDTEDPNGAVTYEKKETLEVL